MAVDTLDPCVARPSTANIVTSSLFSMTPVIISMKTSGVLLFNDDLTTTVV